MSLAQPSASMILLTLHCYFSCVQIHLKPFHWASPMVPCPEVLETTSDWPGQTLGKLQNAACQMCTCQHTTCSGRKPIFFSISSSFGKCACFWHLSPCILLTHWDKEVISFLKPSFPLKKKVLAFSPNSPVDSSIFLYFMYLKLLLFPCIIFLLRFLLKFPSLFLFGVFIFLKSPLTI